MQINTEMHNSIDSTLDYKNVELEMLKRENKKLKKHIEILTSIIKVGNYINAHLLDENLIEVVNNMIVNIIDIDYSSIFIVEKNELITKGSNIKDIELRLTSEEIMHINNREYFLINSKTAIKELERGKKIYSIIGMPIILEDEFMGYIVLSDERYGFFQIEMKAFLEAIAIQIANSIKNSRVYKELDTLTKEDALLNIYNRRYFFKVLENLDSENFALIMMDIDDFKKINDTYGHQQGDEILKSTVKTIKLWLEEDDIIARYGGEEFILCISNFDDKESVYNKIDIIRKSIERNIIKFNDISLKITASFGMAFFPDDSKYINNLIKIADDLLYKSKELGKNSISTSCMVNSK